MDNSFFIHVHNRDYSHYEFFSNNQTEQTNSIKLDIDPIEHRLFHGDIFTVDDQDNVCVQKSDVRSKKHIPGVLILQHNRTYGRTSNKKRLLYRCIPYDNNLPDFLVPSDISLEFSKCLSNKYVLFSFHEWSSRHPQGLLCESLGVVNDLNALAEYELYGHHLQYSLKDMNKQLKMRLKSQEEMVEDISRSLKFKLQHKPEQYVFSIDPRGSKDYDDAFSIDTIDNQTFITVHIANVAIWLEYLQLWNYLTERVSTIYLPNCKKTMLPSILSDQVCSLQQKQRNITMFTRFPILPNGDIDFENTTFGNAIVKVRKNYDYEEPNLLANQRYQNLHKVTQALDSSVSDSHDVVSFWMIQVNMYLAKKLQQSDIGIFRNSTLKYNERMSLGFDKNICDTLFHYKNASSNYVKGDHHDLQHVIMNKDIYTHITSPIRRNVDLLNQSILLYSSSHIIDVSAPAQRFFIYWMNNLDKINEDTKKIKYVQNKLQLIHTCLGYEDLSKEVLSSIVVDKDKKDNMNHYNLLVPKLNVFLPAISDKDFQEYDNCNIRVFVFEDENNVRNKIKIQIV
jgi:exoribonuclease R